MNVPILLGSSIGTGLGSASYIALISASYKKNLKPRLTVLGNISIGGAIQHSNNFSDKVTMLSEKGAKTVISPMDNLQELSAIPQSVLGATDVPFYSNNQILMQKAILME